MGDLMSKFGNQQRIRPLLGLRRDPPHANPVIDAGRRQPRAIGTKRQRIQFLLRFLERVQPLPRRDIPQLHRAIAARAGQNFAIGPKRQLKHRPIMAIERPQLLAAGHIPQLDRVVIAARRQHLSIRTQSGAIQTVFMSAKSRRHTPCAVVANCINPRLPKQPRLSRGSDKCLSIARKSTPLTEPGISLERLQHACGLASDCSST